MRSLSFPGWNRDGQYPWSEDRISIAARHFAILQVEQLLGRGVEETRLCRALSETEVARHLRVGKVMAVAGSVDSERTDTRIRIIRKGKTKTSHRRKEPLEGH